MHALGEAHEHGGTSSEEAQAAQTAAWASTRRHTQREHGEASTGITSTASTRREEGEEGEARTSTRRAPPSLPQRRPEAAAGCAAARPDQT